MPYVKRAASGRINAVYDRPSREAKERVRANDPELLRFLGLAPTQSVAAAASDVMVAPGRPAGARPSLRDIREERGDPAADDVDDDLAGEDEPEPGAYDDSGEYDEEAGFAPEPEPETAAPATGPARRRPDRRDEPENGDEPGDDSALRQLDASDLEMARITEDLIDLMIAKNLINFTDFPTMAQRKLINRRALRSNMSALSNLVGDEESIF